MLRRSCPRQFKGFHVFAFGEDRCPRCGAERYPKVCTAAHPASGYQCERPAGHDGEHQGGDYTWAGSCPRREAESRVHAAVLDHGLVGVPELARRTGMPVQAVRRYLRGLRKQGLVKRYGTGSGLWGEG